ncbi:MAG: alpha/beta fold hydrolase [Saprospiraceae bacterium]
MQLNHKTFGQGEPLIILHGLFGTLDNWQTLAKQWAEHYTVVLVDQRNHGRSPHEDAHTYPLMAEDLRQFMENNWIYEAHILGHSMGGKTAMQFALQHPEMVNKLVVVDMAPKAYSGGHETILEALKALPLGEIADRSEADDFLKERISDFGVRQFLLKNLTRTKNGDYEWKMNLPVLIAHYEDILANVAVTTEVFGHPAHFIRGAKSDYVQDEDMADIRRWFPQATLATIPNAGHWVHAEQPTLLYEEVSRFLRL